MGRVGYAPTTPAMSMQYSTIELTAHHVALKIFVSLLIAYIIEKLSINKVKLKSLKNAPLGRIGIKFMIK